VVKKKLSDYLAGIGRQGGKVSAAKLTKVDRIARAKRASAAQLNKAEKGKRAQKWRNP
jgi:hypothetical protein